MTTIRAIAIPILMRYTLARFGKPEILKEDAANLRFPRFAQRLNTHAGKRILAYFLNLYDVDVPY
ncbi:MAG: hypothetical protein AAGF83_19035 [Cyanobacteria bacterium P01_G01_bin.67]